MESLKLYINVVGGNIQEVCGPKDFTGTIYLVDFDNDDSKELSDAYSLILADDNITNLPLVPLSTDNVTDTFIYEAECSVCEREERINLNECDWMPNVNLDEDDELGPICPECQSKWVVFEKDKDPCVWSHRIALSQMHEVSGLVKHLAERHKQALLEESQKAKEAEEEAEVAEKIKWLKQFYYNMIRALMAVKALHDLDEGKACFEFREDLHGKGPAILKIGGCFEMLGPDICYNTDLGKYVTVPEPSNEYYVEAENSEVLRCHKS